MPWYVWLYLGCLTIAGGATFHDQLEEGRGYRVAVFDAVTTIILLYFVAAAFHGVGALPLFLNIILAAIAIGWNIFDGIRELRVVIAQRPAAYDADLSPRANRIVDRVVEVFAASAGIVVLLPAIACAIAVIARQA